MVGKETSLVSVLDVPCVFPEVGCIQSLADLSHEVIMIDFKVPTKHTIIWHN
jgi:hypothetical protein